jgi:hypothetical protein
MPGNDRERLEQINSSIGTWEQERDAEAIEKLGELLSPELLFRRADGSVVGKPEFMKALRGPSPFATRAAEDVAVEIKGDRALVTLTVVTTKADGTKGRYRNVRLFVRRDDQWHLEFWFNDDVTSVPGL